MFIALFTCNNSWGACLKVLPLVVVAGAPWVVRPSEQPAEGPVHVHNWACSDSVFLPPLSRLTAMLHVLCDREQEGRGGLESQSLTKACKLPVF